MRSQPMISSWRYRSTAGHQTVFDLVARGVDTSPLVVGAGNWGSQSGDPPADPVCIEVALAPFGELAVVAEGCSAQFHSR